MKHWNCSWWIELKSYLLCFYFVLFTTQQCCMLVVSFALYIQWGDPARAAAFARAIECALRLTLQYNGWQDKVRFAEVKDFISCYNITCFNQARKVEKEWLGRGEQCRELWVSTKQLAWSKACSANSNYISHSKYIFFILIYRSALISTLLFFFFFLSEHRYWLVLLV